MSLKVLGIDIAKSKFDIAIKVKEKFKTKVFANSSEGFEQLTDWLKQRHIEKVHACMEATGSYGEALAHYLFKQGHTVSIINAAQIKGFSQSLLTRNKTDRVDAKVIAQFGEAFCPEAWSPPPKAISELQGLVKRFESLQDLIQQENNRLLISSGEVEKSIETVLEMLKVEKARIWQEILNHINKNSDLLEQFNLLLTIPGLGENTAVKMIAKIGDISRFNSGKQIDAFAGLNPRQYQSGSSIRKKGRISKIGHTDLRKSLYFPAIVAKRHNPIIKSFCRRLESVGKKKMVIVCAAMRKLLRIIFGVLKNRIPFDPNLGKI